MSRAMSVVGSVVPTASEKLDRSEHALPLDGQAQKQGRRGGLAYITTDGDGVIRNGIGTMWRKPRPLVYAKP